MAEYAKRYTSAHRGAQRVDRKGKSTGITQIQI